MIKSHEPFDARYPKTIYIARDPRDVAISYYHYLVHFRPQRPDEAFTDFLDDFLLGNVPFGSWNDHVIGWTRRMDDNDFMLLRYEDIKRNPEESLAALASFVGLPHDRPHILGAVEQASFERMSDLENDHLGPRVDEDGRFVRKGESSGWRAELDDASAARIGDAFGEGMAATGYA